MSLKDLFKSKTAAGPSEPLDETLRTLSSRVRQLESDLDDLFDRFQRFQGRRHKREAVDAAAGNGAAQPADAAEAVNQRIRLARLGIRSN